MANESPASTPSLEIPGEPGVYWCARHRKVKTRLRCGRCETPICPKCTKMGPSGARCPDCASHRDSHVYQVSLPQYVMTFLAAIVLSAIGASLIAVVGFLILFYAPVAGTMLGKAVVFVTRGKRGVPLAVVASAGAVLGVLLRLGFTLLSLNGPNTPPGAAVPVLLGQAPYLLVYICLIIPALWWWIK
jgi:hypothetical protein